MVGIGAAIVITAGPGASSSMTARGDENRGAPTVVLASASAGRRAVLRSAGIDPVVLVSGADEDAARARLVGASPHAVVEAVAAAKADAVIAAHTGHPALVNAVVISGDSMLFVDGTLQGKPHTAEETRRRWRSQMGGVGELITGHTVLRVRDCSAVSRASGVSSAIVKMGQPTDAELDAYIQSGEPLEVAGAFTIDGLGGWFVDSIEGDPSCVVGLALPLVRRLLAEVGVRVTDLWTTSARDTVGPFSNPDLSTRG